MMLSRSFDTNGIDHDLKDLFLKHSTRTTYSDNAIIYLQEDSADKLYLVVSGYVRLSYIMEDGTSILYAIVPPGQSFGELGVFHQSIYMDTASAIGQVTVFSVRASVFHSPTEHNSIFKKALSALIAERYKTYIYVTKSLYFCSLAGRLAMSVLRLAQALGQTTCINGKKYLSLGAMVTQSDLGAMARGSRGNVNKLLKSWEREGLIVMQDRSIILLEPNGLEMVALRGGEA